MAVFLQIAGTQLVLPDYARLDIAFQMITLQEPGTGVLPFDYLAEGAYIEVPISLYTRFESDEQLATRTVVLELLDGQENITALASSPAGQAEDQIYNYSFNVGQTGAYGPVGSLVTVGMPVMTLYPGYTLRLSARGSDEGDAFTATALTTWKIPTGPPLAAAGPALPTPVLA